MTLRRLGLALLLAVSVLPSGCATTAPMRASSSVPSPALCSHEVPEATCVRCHPALEAGFRSRGDWCPEHGLPETQCLECHPGMKFADLPPLPEGADLRFVSTMGEDVPDLGAHAVAGKVTVFDFYAAWCVTCRDLELRLQELVTERRDVAVRKLNVMTWDSPVATRYLGQVPSLPYVVVYSKSGERVGTVSGLKLDELDELIARAAR
jgi:thiol-disulfide isomerase/thioredoxin